MTMEKSAIRKKYGDDYLADDYTFIMGIDQRFTRHFADRFTGMNVLETCTGGGFTTISLARTANHVYTVEIDTVRQKKAKHNIQMAGLSSKVSFINGSILDTKIMKQIRDIDAVFIDPDWAVTGPNHVYKFLNSNTRPPADLLLNKMFAITQNIAIILPPFVDPREFCDLPRHELERLYLGESHELYCLYFGTLKKTISETEFRVKI